jgi:hypothetical protein
MPSVEVTLMTLRKHSKQFDITDTLSLSSNAVPSSDSMGFQINSSIGFAHPASTTVRKPFVVAARART